MADINLDELAQQTRKTARKAANFIKAELGKVRAQDIEEKDLNSLVSYVDKEAEKMIVSDLKEFNVVAGFLTEEDVTENSSNNSEYRWVIDPLDGTTNFLKGIPHFSVSISLEHNQNPILGVVDDIMQNDSYWAIANQGAFLNDKSIHTSNVIEMSNAILVTGFPYARQYDLDKTINVIKHWLTHCRAIRRFGSAALDLVYVASGKLDGYYESKLNRWDLSAGVLIVKEAGGVISDYEGNQNHLESGNIIATNSHLYNEILTPIQTVFN